MKITLNELKQLVRQVIKEEEEKTGKKYSDEELREMIKEFKNLKEELEALEPKLKMMKERHKEISGVLVEVMGPLKMAKGAIVDLLEFSLKIEKAGSERESYSYKAGIDFVLSAGPKRLVKKLEEILEASKTVTKISPSISVKNNLDESVIKEKLVKFVEKVKSWFSSFKNKFEQLEELSSDVKADLAKVKKEM